MNNENNSGELVDYRYSALDLGLNLQPSSDEFLDKKTLQEIRNAWNDSGIIDRHGIVWIRTSRLHSILRTSPDSCEFSRLSRQYGVNRGKM